jgi:glycosyltransferase involved in cell wall biosynthesis
MKKFGLRAMQTRVDKMERTKIDPTVSLPKVSIVTPSFNQATFLEMTIRSVLEQDYENIEYIIIDGGSTDGSKEIIQKYAHKLAYWQSEKDKGQTDALNQGFARATGEILAWLNSDDVLYPGAVSAAVRKLAHHPEAAMVYGDCEWINADNQVIGRFPAAQTDLKKLRRGYVHIPQQASFFRADLWRKVGPLDESFYFAMDYDLWTRLASHAPLLYVPEVWAGFRLHEGAKSIAEDDRCWPEMLRVHYRDGGKKISLFTLKYWVRKILQPFWIWLRRKRIKA